MCLESEIKRLARTGHSKQHACELLGMSRGRFNLALELIGPIDWPGSRRSLLAIAAYEARRGKFGDTLRASQYLASRASKAKSMQVVARGTGVTGMVGTIADLVNHYGVAVSACTVRRRIAKRGMTLEQALFTPRECSHVNKRKKGK